MEFQACMREEEDEDALTHLPPRPLLRGTPASAPPPSVTSGRPGLGRKREECGPAWWMALVAKQRGLWSPTLGLAWAICSRPAHGDAGRVSESAWSGGPSRGGPVLEGAVAVGRQTQGFEQAKRRRRRTSARRP